MIVRDMLATQLTVSFYHTFLIEFMLGTAK